MRDETVKEIAGNAYAIGTLTLTKGQDVFLRLARNLGPGLGEFLSQVGAPGPKVGKGKEKDKIPVAAIAAALRDVALRIDATDLTHVRLAFGEVSRVNGKPLGKDMQELHFAGRFGEMFAWLQACIEHNYADFLGFALSASDSPDSSAVTADTESDPPSA